jgi:hypothetical protein
MSEFEDVVVSIYADGKSICLEAGHALLPNKVFHFDTTDEVLTEGRCA